MHLINQDILWKSTLEYVTRKETVLDDPHDFMESAVTPLNELMLKGKHHEERRRIVLSLKQTTTLASLMPNIVLENSHLLSQKIKPLLAVLLRVDISGFTKLSEICVQYGGEDGIFKLTNILNKYFGGMSNMIYENGGDVWKFAGDSLLSLWKVEGKDIMRYVVYRAVRCALLIQKHLGYYDTGFKVVLRLKIGLAVGNVVWSMIGDDFSRRHVIVGAPVNEVRDADHFATSGDVIAAASIWGHMCPLDFMHEVIENGRYVKIFNMISYLGYASPNALRAIGAPGFEDEPSKRKLSQGRVFPDFADNDSLGAILRLCLLDPVVQQVDADLSLDFLTEMRILTVMFVHIIPYNLLDTELIALVDKAYNIIQGLVRSTGGYVDKCCLFDKDIMFVCFFGLRGLYQTDEVARYLRCAHCIREAGRSIDGITEVSIGVTTSNIFCGVIGNDMYQNYTVIGPAANLAARLMCAYPGQVTCDETTRKNSNLAANWFVVCPMRQMRNISEQVVAYEFIGAKSRRLQTSMRLGILPLLGRSTELDEFSKILDGSDPLPGGILIEGDEYAGKSRLVNQLVVLGCKRGKMPVALLIYEAHGRFPYFTAIHILTQALNLGCGKQREIALAELLKDELASEDLQEIPTLCSKCPLQSEPVVSDSMKRVFVTALKKGLKEDILVLDDIDHCDSASFALVMAAVEAHVKFMLLTTRSSRNVPESTLPHLKIWKLKPLSSELVAVVACQTLSARAIHNKVLRFLLKTTQGNPGKCNSTLKSILDQQFIDVVQLEEIRTFSSKIVTVSQEYLVRETYDYKLKQPLTSWSSPDHPVYVDEIKKEKFSHENFLATMKLLKKQGWWKSKDSIYALKQDRPSTDSIPDDTFKVMAADTFHLETDENDLAQHRQTEEYTEMFIDLCGTRKILKDPMPMLPIPFVVFEKGIDEIYIEESINEFILAKESAGKSLAPTGDIHLDTLRKHRTIIEEAKASDEDTVTYQDESISSIDDDNFFSLIPDDEDDFNRKTRTTKRRQTLWSQTSRSSARLPVFNKEAGTATYVPTIVVKRGINLEQDASKPDSYQDLLSIFDSLRPFDQLLLKCCSVIGNKFLRAMVDDLLHHPDPTFTSFAVKRLFELGILRCSQLGRLDKDALCSCRNSEFIIKTDVKLPGYAFCQNLAFRYNKFRDTLYNLLPPNQKRLFHERAEEFLQTQSTLCPVCQVGGADPVMSARNRTGTTFFGYNLVASIPGRAEEIVLLLNKTIGADLPDWNYCTCLATEERILDQMISHSHSAGLMGKETEFLIRKAEFLINVGRHSEAISLLESTSKGYKVATLGKDRSYIIARIEVCYAEIELAENSLGSAIRNIDSAISRIRRLWLDNFIGDIVQLAINHSLLLKGDKTKAGPLVAKALILLASIRLIRSDFLGAQKLCFTVMKLCEVVSIPDMVIARCYGLYMDTCMGRYKLSYDKDLEGTMISTAVRILSQTSVASAMAALRIIHVIANIRTVCVGNLVDGLDLLLAVKSLALRLPVKFGLLLTNVDIICVLLGRIQLRQAAELTLSLKGQVDDLTYHSICLNFFRTTGFWVEEPRNSIRFLTDALSGISLEDNRANREGLVALWLWYLYTKPEFAAEWEKKIVFHSHPELPITVSSLSLLGHETWALLLQLHYSATRSPLKVRALSKRLAKLKELSKDFRYLTPWTLFIKAHHSMWLGNNPSAGLSQLERARTAAAETRMDLLLVRINIVRECWLRGVQPKPFSAADGGEWTKLSQVEESALYLRKPSV